MGAIAVAALVTMVMYSPGVAAEPVVASAEERAVKYLAAEVPKWHTENQCYSCHNNGDAARALLAASAAGLLKDRRPLDDTLRFLARPENWDANGPDGPFKDQKLARIQFAAALEAANSTGVLIDRAALRTAAGLAAELQADDGSWPTDGGGAIGSPVTYGRALATFLARRTLAAADAERYRAAIAKADHYFQATPVNNVLDAAATLWALAGDTTPAARATRDRCRQLIRQGQSSDGGWGPYVNAPPEAFDTALVLLALAAQKPDEDWNPRIALGRKYLLATQTADGSWPATTRPTGVDSYAQQTSTTAWATLALLATRERPATSPRRP